MKRRYQVTVTETYVSTFTVRAEDEEQAMSRAEDIAVERDFPHDWKESCEREISVAAP